MNEVNNKNLFIDNNSQIFLNDDLSQDNNMIKNRQYNKTLVEGLELDFEDRKVRKLLTNKKFLIVLSVLILVFTTITVIKTFYLRSKVNDYEEQILVIDSKESTDMIIQNNEVIDEENLKKVAADELIKCINTAPSIDSLPDNVDKVIKKINNFYNQSNNYFSFKYKDLFTGFTVSYNEHQKIFSASSIKAPKDIYLYEMASLGKINLDEELTYTNRYYNNGSGVLKNMRTNTKYSVRKLLEYSTVTSDNAAHNMLMDKYGRENMHNFWKEKGTEVIFAKNTNWGNTSAHDAVIYMEELYNFYLENDQYGKEVMNNFLSAYPKFLKGKSDYKVANKSGWAGTAIHDMALIFADNPYILVALSNTGTSDYTYYFNTANELAYELHTEYWKYKMDMCGDINQY